MSICPSNQGNRGPEWTSVPCMPAATSSSRAQVYKDDGISAPSQNHHTVSQSLISLLLVLLHGLNPRQLRTSQRGGTIHDLGRGRVLAPGRLHDSLPTRRSLPAAEDQRHTAGDRKWRAAESREGEGLCTGSDALGSRRCRRGMERNWKGGEEMFS